MWVLSLSFFCFFSPSISAENAEETTSYQLKLDNIREKITNVLINLNKNQNKRSNIRSELQKLEIKIAKSSKSLR